MRIVVIREGRAMRSGASVVVAAMVATQLVAGEPSLRIETMPLAKVDRSKAIPPGPRGGAHLPRPTYGYAELASALWSGSPAAVLANGADPNALGPDGEPAIAYALWLGHADRLLALLDSGADPNLANRTGDTPLHAAVRRGIVSHVETLLRYGADPARKNRAGETPVDLAKRYSRNDLANALATPPKAIVRAAPFPLPPVVRTPDAVFGATRFRAPGGSQAIAYADDGKSLIVGDATGALRLFDAVTGERRRAIAAHERKVLGVARVPGTSLVVSVADDTRLFDLASEREVARLAHGSRAVAASRDGRLAFTGYYLLAIDASTPLRLGATVRAPVTSDSNATIAFAFFTPDDTHLILGYQSGAIWAWDVTTDAVRRLPVRSTEARVLRRRDLDPDAVDPDAPLAWIASQYMMLAGPSAVLASHEKAVRAAHAKGDSALALSPDGQWTAAVGHDGRIDRYDLERRNRPEPHDGHTAALLAVAASADGKHVASGGNDQTVRVWERATGKTVAVLRASSFVYSVAFSPDSRRVAFGDNAGYVHVWSFGDNQATPIHASGRMTAVAFMDARTLFALGHDLRAIDVEAGATLATTAVERAGQGPLALAPGGLVLGGVNSISANDTYVAPEAWRFGAKAFAPVRGLFTEAMGHRSFITGLAVSPDGAMVAAASGHAIRLWDLKTRAPLGRPMHGHLWTPHALAFSPDGKRLASAGWDGTIRVWDAPTGRPLLVCDADVHRVAAVAFLPDGTLVSANDDSTVHLWNVTKHVAR